MSDPILARLTGPADLKQLTSGAWQAKTAGSIAQAVDNYFGTRMVGAAASAGGNRGRQ